MGRESGIDFFMISTDGEVQIAAVGLSKYGCFVQTRAEKRQTKKGGKRGCTDATDCITQDPLEEFLRFLQSP